MRQRHTAAALPGEVRQQVVPPVMGGEDAPGASAIVGSGSAKALPEKVGGAPKQ